MIFRAIAVALMLCCLSSPAGAQLDQLFKGLGIGQQSGLTDAKIGSGLKEALKVGTENTVSLTGRPDGYFMNQAIKILMPPKLQTLEKGLRTGGYGPQVDEFILSMNRAAEQAAPSAKKIFWDSIGEMTFDDARKILSGSDTAALGGDLAHQYGSNGSLTGMNLAAAQTVFNDPQFGGTAQTLHPLQGLQGGTVTL